MPGDSLRLRATIKDVVFTHIPKTAGTSVRNAIAAALPDAVNVFDYGANTDSVEGKFVNAYKLDARTPEGLLALRRKFERSQRLFVCGHVAAVKYLRAFHPASFITFLRDPVERVVSAYKHHVKLLNFKGSFAEFYQQPGQINTQSRLLRSIDLRDIGFIGLTERMPEMYAALSRHLDVELKGRKDNVGSRGGGPELDEGTRSRLVALNDEDMELYRHVEANLDYYTDYRARSGFGPMFAEGKVNHRGDGSFRGWAVASAAGRLVEIEVRLGAQVVHRCYADEFMPRLKEQNISPHGVGGFSVQLPPHMLAGQTQVRFVIAGTERDLPGSPVALSDAA
jgi:hypothetical protein